LAALVVLAAQELGETLWGRKVWWFSRNEPALAAPI